MSYAVIANRHHWDHSCPAYRIISIHVTEDEACAMVRALYASADPVTGPGYRVGYRVYPTDHDIARRAIEAIGRWVEGPPQPSEDIGHRYEIWSQTSGPYTRSRESLVISRPTLAEAKERLSDIAQRRGATLSADGLVAHREPAPIRPHRSRWFIVDRDDPDGIGAGLRWGGNPEGC